MQKLEASISKGIEHKGGNIAKQYASFANKTFVSKGKRWAHYFRHVKALNTLNPTPLPPGFTYPPSQTPTPGPTEKAGHFYGWQSTKQEDSNSMMWADDDNPDRQKKKVYDDDRGR